MTTESNTLTRREALHSTIKGAVASSLAVPFFTVTAAPKSVPEPEFVPENDYPFFGYESEFHA